MSITYAIDPDRNLVSIVVGENFRSADGAEDWFGTVASTEIQ